MGYTNPGQVLTDVCSASGSKCSTSLFPSYNTSHQIECTVPDASTAKLLDLEDGMIAVDCVTNATECYVNIWNQRTGPPEIFSCTITECGFTYSENILTLRCAKTSCTVGPNWQPSDVLKNILAALSGWMSYVCDLRSNKCTMHQEQLQEMVIPLQCYSGDCVPMDFHQPAEYYPPFWTKQHIIIAVCIGLAGLFVLCVIGGRILYARSKASYTKLVNATRGLDLDVLATDVLDRYMFDLGFDNVSVTIGEKRILSSASGYCGPGTVTAIMGPSGAGKTTLLHALAGKLSSGTLGGQILMNGRERGASFQRIAGFVTQEDFLIPTLTVRETLNFHAQLRLGSAVSTQARVARVEKVISQLELSHVADSRVGDSLIRGISGGERRRVSIATELVTAPRILFLDEPTSGLDSCTASAIMQTLRDLASSSALTIVLSIHQPRSSIFAAFDNLILLAKGNVLYNGRAAGATAHFAQLGHACPAEYNPADYLIDLITASPKTVLDTLAHHYTTSPAATSLNGILHEYLETGTSPAVPRRVAAMRRGTGASSDALMELLPGVDGVQVVSPRARTVSGRMIDGFVVAEDGVLDPEDTETGFLSSVVSEASLTLSNGSINGDVAERALLSDGGRGDARSLAPLDVGALVGARSVVAEGGEDVGAGGSVEMREFFDHTIPMAPYATSVWRQTLILCQRTGLNVIRNPSLGMAHYAVTLVVALIIGGIYWQVGDDWPGLQNRAGSIFFIISLLSFGSLSALDLFIGERAMFLHERSNGCYRSSTYYISKLICDLIPLRILPPLILATITYYMIGLREGVEHFVWMAFILVLVNVNATALCMAIGAIVPSMAVGNLLAVLIMLFFMLFGGLLLNRSTVGPMFLWLKDLSFFNYAYEAILVNQLEGTITHFETGPGVTVELTGQAVLEKLDLEYSHFSRDVGVLCGMAAGYVLLAYVMLRVRIWLRR